LKQVKLIKITPKYYDDVHTYKILKIKENKVEIQMVEHGEELHHYFIIKETESGDIILEKKNGNPVGVIHNVSGLNIEEYLVYVAERL
jgi:hypothetical protein